MSTPPAPTHPWSLGFFAKHSYLVFAPVVALFLFLGLSHIPFFEVIENKTVDLRFQLRAGSDAKADNRLAFIDIDESTLSMIGVWPIPRSTHGTLLQLLSHVTPAIVAWDVLFPESSRDPDDDKAFAAGAQAVAPMVIGAMLDTDPRSVAHNASLPGATLPLPRVKGDISRLAYHADAAKFPCPALRDATLSGFTDSHPAVDGVRRTLPLMVRMKDQVYPSLVTQMLMQYWKLKPKNVWVTLGKSVDFHTLDEGVVSVPINAQGEFLINYRNPRGFFSLPYAAAESALADTLQNNAPWRYPTTLDDKIVLVGVSAQGGDDLGPSPYATISALPLVHLNVLSNILQRDFLTQVPWWAISLVWIAVAYLSLYLVRDASITLAAAIPFGLLVAYALAAYFLLRYRSVLVPFAWPVCALFAVHAGSILLRWLDEQKSKQAIKAVFGSFVSSNVMNQLLKSPENVKLGGESKAVTIFFSDIRSFSTFSESMQVQELISQLNEYFVRMVNRVIVNDGTLHKFIGDAVMAVWGDVLPSDLAVDAKKAVRAALQMRRELAELNELRRARGLFDFKIGMGLNHGTVVVGNIGAEGQKLEFTVIGDAVNLASRLEGVTKQFHTDFVIGESVRAFLGDEFLLRSIGLLTVKGKTIPIRAYEVFEELADPDGIWDPAWVHAYEKGFNLYLERKFAEAIACFEECLKVHPDDFCTNEYYRESREYLQNPPPADWSGVLKLDSK